MYFAPSDLTTEEEIVTIEATLKSNPSVTASVALTLFSNTKNTFSRVFSAFEPNLDGSISVEKVDNNSLAITGSQSASNSPLNVLTVDNGGNIIWQRALGNGSGASIASTTDGALIVGGHLYEGLEAQLSLIKMTLDGQVVFTQKYGIGLGTDVAAVQGGSGFLLSGLEDLGGSFGNRLIIRTDAQGNELWRKNLGDGEIFKLASLPEGSFLVAGSIGSSLGSEAVITRLDSNGEVVWETFFNAERKIDLALHEGSIWVGATSVSRTFLLKNFSMEGEELQSFTFDNGHELILNKIELKGNAILCTGLERKEGELNAYLLKAATNGEKEWDKRFSFESSTTSGMDVVFGEEDALFMIGHTRERNFILKADLNGNISPCEDIFD